MKLKKILDGVDVIDKINFKDYNIASITHISNDVERGGIFICIKGNNFDGNDYIGQAILRGAKCIVTDNYTVCGGCGVAVVIVKDSRVAMSQIAKNFYNRSADRLKIIGVVGTSGKTTTSILIANILSQFDKNVGVIGTNGIFINDVKMENRFTTPDPIELHYALYQMEMLGVGTVVMEVSAQSIHLNKMYGIVLDKCVFTNLSEEHLDFFGSIENYARCKMNYFNKNNMRECVVNIDDFYGQELAFKLDIPCISYGVESPANSFAVDIKMDLERLQFTANILDDVMPVDSALVGMYNVYNILGALTVCKMIGYSAKDLTKAIKNVSSIEGRFNVFRKGKKTIIVDFAHTPDSISKLLKLIGNYTTGKIISLFGCVGYSNRDKRLAMAKEISIYSDMAIVTTDNRGQVLFEEILKDIKDGLTIEHVAIEDRYSAIDYGFDICGEGDVLVLIGKGAENFQKIGNERMPYNEIEYIKSKVDSDN